MQFHSEKNVVGYTYGEKDQKYAGYWFIFYFIVVHQAKPLETYLTIRGDPAVMVRPTSLPGKVCYILIKLFTCRGVFVLLYYVVFVHHL